MSSYNVLLISGSLREKSLNAALLRTAASVALQNMSLDLNKDIEYLPLFNQDIDRSSNPSVCRFCNAIKRADAIIIASPEYAHGISGPLKNALDWLVGGLEFVDKPVAIYDISSRYEHSKESLREVLRTMSADIVDKASFVFGVLGQHQSSDSIIQDAEICQQLQTSLKKLKAHIQQK